MLKKKEEKNKIYVFYFIIYHHTLNLVSRAQNGAFQLDNHIIV
jgi:hypothetical protein